MHFEVTEKKFTNECYLDQRRLKDNEIFMFIATLYLMNNDDNVEVIANYLFK